MGTNFLSRVELQPHIFNMAATTTLLAALATTTMVAASASDLKQALLSEGDYTSTFNEWTKTHHKNYRGAERDYRYSTFKRNHDLIHKHNADGSKSFKLGHNQFSDMSNAEFKATMMGLAKNPNYGRQGNLKASIHVDSLSDSVPATVDWRTAGAVTPVKNQGSCGSCWSFSTTGSIEGANKIKTGKLISLSEQQLVYCSSSYGNMGCNGGLMDNAFKYAETNALCTEEQYPYTAKKSPDCFATNCNGTVEVASFMDVPSNDEKALALAVSKGPVSVAIEADQSAFQFYKSGVFPTSECGTNLDHGVLVVGYGQLEGKNYWTVKNSWGATWGLDGFILLAKDVGDSNSAGTCGVASQPSQPTTK